MAEISLRGVRKSYGKLEVVHGVDLSFQSGEFVVILGPSGCGKSTLLRMIAGLEDITGGEISIGGKVVNQLEPRARGCAMVFQNYALYPHMSVADNIGYALKVAGVSKAERSTRIAAVAETLSLTPYLERKPAALSGGQRQRVAMGRAMIREPRVFLFDEPLSNLDAKLRVQMRMEIRRLHRRLSTTSVFVTHDQIEAMTLADRLVVMNQGYVEQVGRPADVYRAPATRFVAGFIGSPAMNFIEATFATADRLRLADGGELAMPAELPRRAPGSAITVGFRAEAVSVVAIDDKDALPFTVEFVEELGAERLLHGRMAGADVVVALPPGPVEAAGSRLGIKLPPEELHFFEPEGGARIEQATRLLAAE